MVSNKTILKNHPFVENADEEEKQLEKEKMKAAEEADEYRRAFQKQTEGDQGGEIDGEEE